MRMIEVMMVVYVIIFWTLLILFSIGVLPVINFILLMIALHIAAKVCEDNY